MRTIKLTIAYDGTAYNDWQIQKNGRTVQNELEEAIEKVFGRRARINGAGRTDTGVHAKGQVAHFKINSGIPVEKILPAMNALLPEDISVVKAEDTEEGFHSRFDAVSKHYRYHIFNSSIRDPFKEKYTWRVLYKLDLKIMKKEAQVLEGSHDFRSFQAKDKKQRNSTRCIHCIEITKKGRSITVDIEGDGFLYNMVRNIVGTLVDIGRGYLPSGSMKKILEKRDRTSAGPTAPAKGLFLLEVKY